MFTCIQIGMKKLYLLEALPVDWNTARSILERKRRAACRNRMLLQFCEDLQLPMNNGRCYCLADKSYDM